jgi:hypothetical protein
MGVKDVENRSWLPTVENAPFRGRLLIHQGQSEDSQAMSVDWIRRACERNYGGLYTVPSWYGCIIGSVEVYDVQEADACELEWAQAYRGWCWLLRNPLVFTEPQFWRGRQKLWDIDLDELNVGEALPPEAYVRRVQEQSLQRTGIPKGYRD